MPFLFFALSLIPALSYFFFMRNLKEDEHYRKNCGKLLFRGMLCSGAVLLLDLAIVLILNYLHVYDYIGAIGKALIKCFVINAFAEELVKVATANRVIRKEAGTVSWMDCICYVAMSSLGFQILESFVYMFMTNVPQILIRGLDMMHLCFGMIEGRFIGKRLKTGKKVYSVLTLAATILIHGLYNFGLEESVEFPFDLISFLLAIASVIFWICMIFWIRKRKDDPEFTSPLCDSGGGPGEAAEKPRPVSDPGRGRRKSSGRRAAVRIGQGAGQFLLHIEEGLSRLYPRRVRKSLSDANLEQNRLNDVRNTMITDQDEDRTTGINGMHIGKASVGRCGCEVIAVNNALVYLGRDASFAELEHLFEVSGALTKAPFVPIGEFGGNPYAIRRTLRALGVDSMKVSAAEMNAEPGAYIFSYWNRGGLFDGLHTVFSVFDGTCHTVYNYGYSGTARLDPAEWERRFSGRFITACRIEGASVSTPSHDA